MERDSGATISRRAILSATVGAALAVHALRAHAADSGGAAKSSGVAPALAAARHCIAEGEACLAHGYDRFRAGDASLAACAHSVEEMLAVCAAFVRLATLGSKHLTAYAPVCAEVCRDCEAECREHAEHPPCAASAEACKAMVAALEALKA